MNAAKAKIRSHATTRKKGKRSLILTAKQRRFVDAYVKAGCVDPEAAAIVAGYSPKTAGDQARQTLAKAHIKQIVAKAQRRAADKADVKAAEVVREWARIAFADVRDLLSVAEGKVKVKPSDQWPERASRAVAEVRQLNGGGITLKLHSKTNALDSLGRYLGILADKTKNEHTGPDGGPILVKALLGVTELSDEELQVKAREALRVIEGTNPTKK